MGNIHKIKPSTPRKISEVEWKEGGLGLSSSQSPVAYEWFWPCVLTLPLGAFLLVFFW